MAEAAQEYELGHVLETKRIMKGTNLSTSNDDRYLRQWA